MLDIKLIRERPDFVKGELAKRGVDPAEVDRILEADHKRRKLQANSTKSEPTASGGRGRSANCRLKSAPPRSPGFAPRKPTKRS